MENEYPTEEELQTIRDWPYEKGWLGLANYVENRWHWPDFGYTLRDWAKDDFDVEYREMRLVTGGWSGNESIICALYDNMMFRMVCWQSSHRGGLHIFHINKLK